MAAGSVIRPGCGEDDHETLVAAISAAAEAYPCQRVVGFGC